MPDRCDLKPGDDVTLLDTLNARQEAFCQSYARNGNATQAAKDAGYSQKTAYAQGFRLLRYAEISSRIETIRAERFQKLHMGADELLALMAGQARNPLANFLHITPDGDPYIDLAKASPEDLAHVKEVTIEDFTDGREVNPDTGETIKREVRRVKLKMASPDSARSTLAKQLGLLKDKIEVDLSESAADIMQAAFERSRQARAKREDEGNG